MIYRVRGGDCKLPVSHTAKCFLPITNFSRVAHILRSHLDCEFETIYLDTYSRTRLVYSLATEMIFFAYKEDRNLPPAQSEALPGWPFLASQLEEQDDLTSHQDDHHLRPSEQASSSSFHLFNPSTSGQPQKYAHILTSFDIVSFV